MPRSFTNYQIKLLAVLFMAIDHIGVVLFPEIQFLRVLGRFSFPLFGWLLVQGEQHTHNVYRYALRLLGVGILSQPIYMLTFEVQRPNILFTLLLGLFCLRVARTLPQWEPFVWLGGALLATAIDTEYGAYGIVMIALIGKFEFTGIWWASWLLFHLITVIIAPSLGISQSPAISSPLLFAMANHQPGEKARWFYWFYPLHLLLLFLLRDRFIPVF